MMNIIRTILLAVILVGMPLAAQAGSLTVLPSRLIGGEGHVDIAVYDSEDHYAKQETPVRRAYIVASEFPRNGFTFKNLPEGFYAVAMYHDVNNNGIFDQTFFGWPLEGFGFSHDVVPMLTLPDFKDTSFYLAGNSNARQKLVMRYWGQFDFEAW